jgi:hypothetical protein
MRRRRQPHGDRRAAFRPKRGLLSSAIMQTVSRQAHVTLSGDIAGEYVVVEERPDGELTLAPDTGIAAIRKRHDLEPATLAEFEAQHGPVRPPDGEG